MTSRRGFLKIASATAVAGPAVLPWSAHAQAAAEGVGRMKITKVEAVRFREDLRIQGIAPNWMWVRLHTDKGIVGVGESYPGWDAHRGALKEIAPIVLGKDATQIERL
jgi:hypothetical protein